MTGLIGCSEMLAAVTLQEERRAIENDIRDLIFAIKRQIDFTQEYEKVGMNQPEWQRLIDVVSTVDRQSVAFVSRCDDVEIYADSVLGKIFEYLIENSIKHGETVTRVSLSSEERPEGLALIYVDNGVGIAEDKKQKIFEPSLALQQGVHLFLVREILAITNISIVENGVAGLGARFEMMIPRAGYRYIC